MKRFLFFLLAAGAIGGSVFVLLFNIKFFGGIEGQDFLKTNYDLIMDGEFKFGTEPDQIFLYGLVFYLLISAVVSFTLLIMLFTTGFMLRKIRFFYSLAVWLLFAAAAFTGTFIYMMYKALDGFKSEIITEEPLVFVPLGSAVVLFLIGSFFKRIEKRKNR